MRIDSVKTDKGYVTVRQPARLIDQVVVGFYEEKVCSVTVKRREETASEKGVFGR